MSEALCLCGQIAEALEAAHERGVVHRDLKPANVKVTPEGRVKVLDFGLAKAFAGNGSEADPSSGATLTEMGTEPGAILGTPSYMSPEQVRGKKVDKRTDIWAFGCVLYELLTGQRPFQSRDRKGAGTVQETIAAVLEREPDWTALPATPANIRTLLRRCLQKDADRRLHDMADARIEIEEALIAPTTLEATAARLPARPSGNLWRWALVSGLCLLLGALVAGVAIWNLRTAGPRRITRSAITLPSSVVLANLNFPEVAISPDGSLLAYVAIRGGPQRIFLRALDSLESK